MTCPDRLYELAFIQKARPAIGVRLLNLALGLYELAFIQKARLMLTAPRSSSSWPL